MAYRTVKQCARCEVKFLCGSNRQLYCSPCQPLVRQDKNKLWQHDYYMKNQTQKLEGYRAYNKSEKGRASQMVRDAVRAGKLERKACEVCASERAQGHHDDYSKPLEVRWLCAKHHREEHLFEPWQNELRRAGYTGGFLLGQLIEACGEDFDSLDHLESGRWEASQKTWCCDEHGESREYAKGSTPSDAVARLWLQLNKPN